MLKRTDQDGVKWVVAKVKSQQEVRAIDNLKAQNFESFWPHRIVTVRHARQISERRKSVFPGYIFVKSSLERIAQLNSTRGIQYVLGFQDGHPNVIPEVVMKALARRFSGNGLVKKDDTLKTGDKVQVANGPFQGYLGEIEQASESDRIFVLLSISDAYLRCSIDTADVEKIHQSA